MKRRPHAPQRKTPKCDPDSWSTPQSERVFVMEVFAGIPDLDVAATKNTAFGLQYYSRRKSGLVHPWRGRVWLQPPYSTLADWIERAAGIAESMAPGERTSILGLFPVRTGRSYWRSVDATATAVYFPRGRIRFVDPVRKRVGTNPTFDSVYVLWDPFALVLEPFRRAVAERGGILLRPERNRN